MFAIAEVVFFFTYFFLIACNKKIKIYLQVIFTFFVLFLIVDNLFLRKKTAFNSISAGIEAILIITLCLYYFYEKLKEPNSIFIYNNQSFWVTIGFLIFQCGTFFLYIYTENTPYDSTFIFQYLGINSSFAILKNILFSIAMLKKPEMQTLSVFPKDNLSSDWDILNLLKK